MSSERVSGSPDEPQPTDVELRDLLAGLRRDNEQLRAELTRLEQSLAALTAERDLLRAVIDQVPYPIWLRDTQDRLLLSNAADAALVGAADPQQLLGTTDTDLFSPELAAAYGALKRRILETGQPALEVEQPFVPPGGAPRWLATNQLPLRDASGQIVGILGVAHDITERKLARQALERRLQELAALHETALEVSAQLDLSQLLHTIVRRAVSLAGLPMGTLYLMQPDGETLKIVAVHNLPDDFLGLTQRLGEGLAGRVAQSGQAMSVPDYRVWEGRVPKFAARPARRVLVVPMKVRGRVVGVLDVGDDRMVGDFSPEEIRVIELFAAQAAIAVENAHLYAQAQAEIARRAEAEAELSANRLFLSNVLDAIGDGILVLDPELNIVSLNRIMEERHGRGRSLLGRKCYEALHGLEQPCLICATRQALVSGRPEVVVVERGEPGNRGWYELHAFPMFDDAGRLTGIVEHVRDVTARQQAEQALQQYAERLAVLRQVDQAILAAQSPPAIFEAITGHLMHLLPCQLVSLVMFDPEGGPPALLVCRAPGHVERCEAPFVTWPTGESGQQEPIVVADIGALDHPSPLDQLLQAQGMRSHLQVALTTQKGAIGYLGVAAAQADAFTAEHLALLAEVSASLAIAIHQAQLYERVQREAHIRATLLDEVNHRVRNNLAAMIGLLHLERRTRQVTDAAAFDEVMNELIRRVEGLSAAHQLLTASGWAPVPFEELARLVVYNGLRMLPPDRAANLEVNLPPVEVRPDQAHNLALVLSELTLNALKYAFGDRPQLNLTLRGRLEHGVFEFEFGDDGPGYPHEVLRAGRESVGLNLIRNLVRQALRGEVRLANDGGARTLIRFPLRQPENAHA